MNDLVSLSQLFDKSIFRIPDYQRGYAWEKEQLDDFFDDLSNLTDDRYHYTGMLSLKRLKHDDYKNWEEEKWIIEEKEYKAFHVVDGQQRLTTFIILVNSILNLCVEKNIEYLNGDEIDVYKNRYIIEYKKPAKILKAFKFGYETDNPSFQYLRHHVLQEGSSGALTETFYTLNLGYAKSFFDEKVLNLYKEEGQDGIEKLFRKLVNKLKFNIHYIDDDFDVFVAFETMNNRGKKLSNLEILKNRLIYLTTIYPSNMISVGEKKKLRKNINDAWKEVYFQLGRNKNSRLDDDEYLKNHWTMYFKYTRNKGDDYINFLLGYYFNAKSIYGIQNYLDLNDDDMDDEYIPNDATIDLTDGKLYPHEIDDYVKSLESTAKYWYYSFNPSDCPMFGNDEIKWIEKLNRIGINYFRTLVVASFINQNVTSSQRIILFKTIEKFIFLCFRMGRYQSSYLSNVSYNFARDLLKNDVTIDEVIAFFESKFNDNKIEASKSFLNIIGGKLQKNNGYYDWQPLKYLLFEYELSLSEKTFVSKLNDWSKFTKNEKDKISIEHIFPQTPSNYYWRNQFRDFNEEEQKILTNSLGNLLALSSSVNSSLQNDEFYKKKESSDKRIHGYSNGSHSEIEVSKNKDWTPYKILERGMHLLEFMETRWSLSFDDSMKYELLGLEFMQTPRTISAELPVEE